MVKLQIKGNFAGKKKLYGGVPFRNGGTERVGGEDTW